MRGAAACFTADFLTTAFRGADAFFATARLADADARVDVPDALDRFAARGPAVADRPAAAGFCFATACLPAAFFADVATFLRATGLAATRVPVALFTARVARVVVFARLSAVLADFRVVVAIIASS